MKRPRWTQRWRAVIGGYFWLPCPLCHREFGGHEWADIDGKPSVIPTGRGTGLGICPDCTAAGLGNADY